MFQIKTCAFALILFVSFQSCNPDRTQSASLNANQAQNNPGPVGSAKDLVAAFPVSNIREVPEAITPAEFQGLIETGQSQHWKLEKDSEKLFTISNREYDDNEIKFLVLQPDTGLPMLVVQEVNAQVVVTKGWRFNPETKEWFDLGFPVLAGKQFASENAEMPDGYDDMTTFLNIELLADKIKCSVNQWTISRDLEESYPQLDSRVYKSLFKYYYDVYWNGEEFTIDRKLENDYSAVFDIAAEVQTDDADGPGITEFDCRSGYTIDSSSELKSAGLTNYAPANLLRDDETVWSEGNAGSGVDDYVEFEITDNFLIGTNYQLRNGYCKSPSLWKANNRVKTFDVLLNSKKIASVKLSDSDRYQAFTIIPPFIKGLDVKKGDKIRFVIKDVYKGEKYDDTVITYFVTQGNCG